MAPLRRRLAPFLGTVLVILSTLSVAQAAEVPEAPAEETPAVSEEQPAADQGGFWSKGVAGLCGGRVSWLARTIAVFLHIILIGACFTVVKMEGGFALGPFLIRLALLSILYLLYWGIPTGFRWGWLAANLLLAFNQDTKSSPSYSRSSSSFSSGAPHRESSGSSLGSA